MPFAVLLYPPVGSPRVVEFPPAPQGYRLPVKHFAKRETADKALAKFLNKNPEYVNWKDGKLR